LKNDDRQVLYQKKGVTISNVASSLLSRNAGDRIPPISYYQEEYGVSRGTIQNAFRYLKEAGAVELVSHGHMGTYIEKIDYVKLQDCTLARELLGIMPLPYSRTYEGFATAIYEQLKEYRFNMAYARGAVGRIQLVESGTYQFAVCSQYAAENAIEEGREIEIALNFGPGSFLSRHVLILGEKFSSGIQDGMRVAYDRDSLDQKGITENLIRGKKVWLVDIRVQQTLSAIEDGVIDAGVWNYDDIIENPSEGRFHVEFLEDDEYNSRFSTAVIVIQKGNSSLEQFLKKNIRIEYTLKVLDKVRKQKMRPFY